MAHRFKTASVGHHHRDYDDPDRPLKPLGEELIADTSGRVVTASDAKEHARVDDPSGELDGQFEGYIDAVEDFVERYTSRTLLNKQYRFYYARFPGAEEPFQLRHGPLVSVDEIKYHPEDSSSTTVSTSDYEAVNRTTPKIFEAANTDWPTTTLGPKGVEVKATMGHGTDASDVPKGLHQAIKELVKSKWDNPDTESQGSMLFQRRAGGLKLLDKFKVKNF